MAPLPEARYQHIENRPLKPRVGSLVIFVPLEYECRHALTIDLSAKCRFSSEALACGGILSWDKLFQTQRST